MHSSPTRRAELEQLASPVASAREGRAMARRAAICEAAAAAMHGAMPFESQLAEVLRLLSGALGCEHASLLLMRRGRLMPAVVDATPMPPLPPPESGDAVAGAAVCDGPRSGFVGASVIQTGEVICLHQAEADPRFNAAYAPTLPGVRVRSLLAAPLRAAAGQPLGVIELVNCTAVFGFDATDSSDLVALCAMLSALLPTQ